MRNLGLQVVRLCAVSAPLVALVLTTASAAAGTCSWDYCDECDLSNCRLSCCYDPPELWLVNTRCVPKCSNLDWGFEHISWKRYDRERCCWVRETRESFLAQEANMPTLIFAHGNTLKHPQAMEQCWDIYRRMRCCPGQKRLVFWSWPAEVVYKRPIITPRKTILKNLRIKFVYSEYQGYYMAKLVQQMSLAQRTTIGGHSYGCIHGAVAGHYLGGGCLRGLILDGGAPVERPNLRICVVSGAFDNDSMCLCGRYGQSFIAAEKVFNTRNRRDSTLKNWHEVSFRGRPATGYTGINPACLGEYAYKLCQMTTTAEVGKSHYIGPHLESNRFMAALCCFAFPKCCERAKALQQGIPYEHGVPGEEVVPADEDAPLEPIPSGFSETGDDEAEAVCEDDAWVEDLDSGESEAAVADAGAAADDQPATTTR
jgi:hypothetical protein